MGIEPLAVFPAFVVMVAMVTIIISGLKNIRHMSKALLFSIVLMVCTSAVLFAAVFIFEFLGLAIIGEIFYLGAVGVMIYSGLKYGRKRFYFTAGELMLQGIIAICGCAAAALFFLGFTVRI
jgi:hypothetical protein